MVDEVKLVCDWLTEKYGEVENLDSIDLLATGVMSSIDVVDLMVFVEKISNSQIPVSKLDMNTFRTVPEIVSLIKEIRVA